MKDNEREGTSAVARLRALMPNRGLNMETALGLAERQATLLLELAGITSGPVSLNIVSNLPHVELTVASTLPSSGLSYWTGDHWRLEVNGSEPVVRQRFTAAHEFKHVLDNPGRDLYYANHRIRERAADQFAACLLMPRRQIILAWCSGEQDIRQLANHFVVSVGAMTCRLTVLGLIEEPRRSSQKCSRGSLQFASCFAIAGGPTGRPAP